MGRYQLDAHEAALVAEGAPFALDVDKDGIRTYRNAPGSIAELLGLLVGFREREFLVFERTRLTYGEALDEVARLRGYLTSMGLVVGDRVGLAMRNYPEWVISFLAVMSAGMVVVPLNAWWLGQELAFGIEDSGARVVLVDEEREERLRGLVSVPLLARTRELARPIAAVAAEVIVVTPDAPAAIFYTSGTTGVPKGVVLTHRNLTQAVWNSLYLGARTFARLGMEPPSTQGVNLVSIPLFHVTGAVAVLLAGLMTGSKYVLTYRFDPLEALALIERERVTAFGGVPAVASAILRHPERDRFDLSSVAAVSYGGAPSAPELVRRVLSETKALPGNGYGLTETTGIATFHNGASYAERPRSAGPPTPNVDVAVRDLDGGEVGDDVPGELLVRGSTVFAGYWGRPDATAAAFRDGWFRTGDIATISADGYVTIVDRAKDLIIRGGENVSTVEVEAAIMEHPAVVDAAVVGVVDERLGERVAAVVVKGAPLDPDELRSFLGERLSAFKVPEVLVVRDEPLPRNPAGKTLKRVLREELEALR
jgi:long-chain acyl-CoA synthetase